MKTTHITKRETVKALCQADTMLSKYISQCNDLAERALLIAEQSSNEARRAKAQRIVHHYSEKAHFALECKTGMYCWVRTFKLRDY